MAGTDPAAPSPRTVELRTPTQLNDRKTFGYRDDIRCLRRSWLLAQPEKIADGWPLPYHTFSPLGHRLAGFAIDLGLVRGQRHPHFREQFDTILA